MCIAPEGCYVALHILPSKHSRHMQATLQSGDAGKELDNLRLLESMGLEVRPQHVARHCAGLKTPVNISCHAHAWCLCRCGIHRLTHSLGS